MFYQNGGLDHEVLFSIRLGPDTPDSIKGLIRDFEWHQRIDSTGWIEGEDSFFAFPIRFERKSLVNDTTAEGHF